MNILVSGFSIFTRKCKNEINSLFGSSSKGNNSYQFPVPANKLNNHEFAI